MLGSYWKDGDAIRFGTGMDQVTPECLICLWMFPGFARESSPPSPHPPYHRSRLGLYGMIRETGLVHCSARAVIKFRTCILCSLFPSINRTFCCALFRPFSTTGFFQINNAPLITFFSFGLVLLHLNQIWYFWYWYIGNIVFIWCPCIW